MADALRAARTVPAFLEALDLHLVETSESLRAEQRTRLAEARPVWHERVETVPPGPLLVVANEFFDALPIRQFERIDDDWRERVVALAPSSEAFRFAAAPAPCAEAGRLGHAPAGAIVERAPAREALAAALAARVAADGGAALIVDYGHARPGTGDTLQALSRHRRHGVLDDPGDADLTAHVDFSALAAAARRAGAGVFGPLPQGAFLEALGIEERAAALRRNASASQARPSTPRSAASRARTEWACCSRRWRSPTRRSALCPASRPGRTGGAMTLPIRHALLEDADGRIRHGFFGREGGVSEGLYRSLNCGLGSGDDPEAVGENRARAVAACDLAPDSLCSAYQVHSASALAVSTPWKREDAPRVDAMATATPGLALAILTADCVPVLLADSEAGVIGAAHAGWRGALNGVLEAAVEAMQGLGARAAASAP